MYDGTKNGFVVPGVTYSGTKILSDSENNMCRRQKIFRAIDRIGVDIPGDDFLVYLRANAGLQPELS